MSHNCKTTFANGKNPFTPPAAELTPAECLAAIDARVIHKYQLLTITREIREFLFNMGEADVATIAAALGISKATVQQRLNAMSKKNQTVYSQLNRSHRLTPEASKIVGLLRSEDHVN